MGPNLARDADRLLVAWFSDLHGDSRFSEATFYLFPERNTGHEADRIDALIRDQLRRTVTVSNSSNPGSPGIWTDQARRLAAFEDLQSAVQNHTLALEEDFIATNVCREGYTETENREEFRENLLSQLNNIIEIRFHCFGKFIIHTSSNSLFHCYHLKTNKPC